MTERGQALLKKMTRLSAVKSEKDLPQLTQALFPGTHCPLMGAIMAAGGIKDSLVVIVGTDECAYYAKSMTVRSEKFGGIGGRCVSIVLDSHDVTFGSLEKTEKAFAEIFHEYTPACVFVVTTCVIEIIGDDFDELSERLSIKYNIPVLPVHTEHFKCEDHLPGLERTITACFALMNKLPCNHKVNILGQRLGDFNATELNTILQEAGVEIGLQLPSGCTVEDVKNAGGARANIVVNDIALPLAKLMKEKLGIPYTYFNRFANPENIYIAYQELFSYLDLKLPDTIEKLSEEANCLADSVQEQLQGKTYIYGNTPYDVFEFNLFLTTQGMVPQVIQTNRFSDNDEFNARSLQVFIDPYLCKSANIAPMRYIYQELKPYLYFGHEYPDQLRKLGIAIVHLDAASNLLGFEASSYLLKQIVAAVQQAETFRKEATL